jgi:hypothetical protein
MNSNWTRIGTKHYWTDLGNKRFHLVKIDSGVWSLRCGSGRSVADVIMQIFEHDYISALHKANEVIEELFPLECAVLTLE